MRRIVASLVVIVAAFAGTAAAQTRIGDLTVRAGDVPRRLVGYGIVTGLEGTGDRSFGGFRSESPTVRSVVNLLKRFNVVVPAEAMRMRNVAAVLVTAEASPYLHSGGRFEVQISSLGDATSLRGGVLWMTPMVTDPNQPPVATAQGPLLVTDDGIGRLAHRGTSGRIPEGGVLEVDPPPAGAPTPRLVLRHPDLGTAMRIADAINTSAGANTAKVEDPGSIALTPQGARADNLLGLLASIDTLTVTETGPSRIIISAKDGTVVAGGDVRVAAAAVSHRGITLRIGGPAAPAGTAPSEGSVLLATGASVEDVAAGLHAAGATSGEIASIFESLVSAGAMHAQVVIQ
jgi:flagellar P-ring protein FlgI